MRLPIQMLTVGFVSCFRFALLLSALPRSSMTAAPTTIVIVVNTLSDTFQSSPCGVGPACTIVFFLPFLYK